MGGASGLEIFSSGIEAAISETRGTIRSMDGRVQLITIRLNGESATTEARTLRDLVASKGFAGQRIATAVNGRFVPAGERDTTALKAGDRVEIVSPRQGG